MPNDPDKPDCQTPADPSDDAAATAPPECGKRRPAAGRTVFCYPTPEPYRLDVLNDQDVGWGY